MDENRARFLLPKQSSQNCRTLRIKRKPYTVQGKKGGGGAVYRKKSRSRKAMTPQK